MFLLYLNKDAFNKELGSMKLNSLKINRVCTHSRKIDLTNQKITQRGWKERVHIDYIA